MSSVEKEIIKGIMLFAREKNIHLSDKDIIDIEKKTSQRRIFNMCEDTYLSVCNFLDMSDIFTLVTLCKEFKTYYAGIWNIIHNRLFHRSILPIPNYSYMKNNIVQYCWHYKKYQTMVNNCYNNKNYEDAITDDINIKKRYDELKHTYNKRIIMTHNAEIKATKKTRNNCVKKLPYKFKELINQFNHLCETDPSGDKYLFAEKNIDMRLYGLNPENCDDLCKWNDIGLKWISGEFNTYEIKIDTDEYYDMVDNVCTDYEYYINDYGYYKSRIYPEWLN
jgi:hypothetical protein